MALICEKLGDERGDGHKKVLQLWVGNEDAAGDETLLRGQNIKSRMSLMGRPTKRLKNVIDCMFYDGDEMGLCEQTDPLKLEALIRDILQNWSSGSLLLYCSQGRRRSVWAAAWTLIIECGLTPADAQRHVHSCRRIATFARNFDETARNILRRLPSDLLREDLLICPKVVPKQTFCDLMQETYLARTPSPEPPEPAKELKDVKEETSSSSDVKEVRAALVSGVEEEEEEESEESEEAEGEESEEESEEEDEVPPVAARPAAAPPTKAPRTQKPAGDAAPAVAAPAAAAAAPPTKAPRTKKPAVDPAPAVAPPAAAAAARSAKAAPAAPEASTGAVLAGSTSKAQPAPPAAPAAPAALAASTSKEPVALSVRGASASSSSIMFTNSFKPTSEII